MFDFFRSFFSTDLAIDLGSSNTLIYVKDRGVVCNEPSIVAVTDDNYGRRKVVAVGHEAKNLLGKTPDKIISIRPIKEGVITDFEITEQMLRRLIAKVGGRRGFIKPRIIVCVPHGITEVEKKAVRDSAYAAGARQVHLIEEPVAAAIGAGLPIAEATGNMVLDIGGGTTEIAIISMKGIVFSQSIRNGGDKMDEAIQNYVKRRFNILIGERTAEQIKISVGAAVVTEPGREIELSGRDLVQGVPKLFKITEEEVNEALQEPLYHILSLVRAALEKTPPELSSDIIDRGITLTGGCALLKNLDKLIMQTTGLPVTLVADPVSAVVTGSGIVLDRINTLGELLIQ